MQQAAFLVVCLVSGCLGLSPPPQATGLALSTTLDKQPTPSLKQSDAPESAPINEIRESYSVHRSWSDRVEDSMSDFIFGIVTLVLTPVLIFAAETQSVKAARFLDRARSATIGNVSCDRVQRKYESRMVHLHGRLDSEKGVVDKNTGITPTSPSVRLTRTVEVYHWRESSEKKKNETVYT